MRDRTMPGRNALQPYRGLLAERRGTAALEFAVIGLVMASSFVALVDLGNVAQQDVQLQQAVRAGGSYAALYPSDTTGITSAVKNAMPAGLKANVTVATPVASFCCWTLAGGTTGCATGSVSTCAAGAVVQRFLTLTASLPYTPLMSHITSNTAGTTVRYE